MVWRTQLVYRCAMRIIALHRPWQEAVRISVAYANQLQCPSARLRPSRAWYALGRRRSPYRLPGPAITSLASIDRTVQMWN